MNIAWTYLLHAHYRRTGVEYRFYRRRGTRRYFDRTDEGSFKYWDLAKCLAASECPLDNATKRLWDPVVRAVGGSAKRESELLVIALWDALRPGEGVITIGYVQLVRARRLEFDLVGGRGILGAHAGRVAQRAALEDTDRTRQPQSTTTSKPGTHQTAPQRPERPDPDRNRCGP